MTRWRLAVAGVLALLIAVPLVVPFLDLLQQPAAWRAWAEGGRMLLLARNTLLLVGGTLLLVMPAGVAGAFLLYRSDLPGRQALRLLTVLTLFVPLPLFASAWQATVGSGGLLPLAWWNVPPPLDPSAPPPAPAWTPWGQGLAAAVWVHAVAALPWVVLLVGQGLAWVERELEEDAALAAGPGRVFLGVTLRRSLVAVGAAALWVGLQAGTEVTVTDMMQVRTFAEEVYTQYVRPEPDEQATTAQAVQARAVAVSLPPVLLTAVLVLAAVRWWERRLPPLATRTAPPRPFRLGWMRWPCLALALLAVGVLVCVPVASLVWKAGRAGSPPTWTLATTWTHVSHNLHAQAGLVTSSVGVALAAGATAAALGLLACWLAVGSRWFQAGLLVLIAAAWALPGPVIGLGLSELFLFLSNATGSDLVERLLRSGPSYLPVYWACLVRFFPCAVALLWPVVRLLPPELRDAARVDGAGPAQEFRHVVWALAGLAWVQAAWAVAVLALGELGAGRIVSTPGSPVFAHEIFQRMHYGVTNDLAALCLVVLAVVGAGGAVVAGCGWLLERFTGEPGTKDY